MIALYPHRLLLFFKKNKKPEHNWSHLLALIIILKGNKYTLRLPTHTKQSRGVQFTKVDMHTQIKGQCMQPFCTCCINHNATLKAHGVGVEVRLRLLFALLQERAVDFLWVIFSSKSTQDSVSLLILLNAWNHLHAFTLILIILAKPWEGKISIPSWTHRPASRKQNNPKSPNAASLCSVSSCGGNRAESWSDCLEDVCG